MVRLVVSDFCRGYFVTEESELLFESVSSSDGIAGSMAMPFLVRASLGRAPSPELPFIMVRFLPPFISLILCRDRPPPLSVTDCELCNDRNIPENIF